MAVTIVTKQHDTKITFKDTPSINGVVVPPADLAGCTLRFLMKTQDGSAPAVAQPATINVDGTFSYQPIAADVANIGKFQQEWELKYPSNQLLTFPNNGYNLVKILPDLG